MLCICWGLYTCLTFKTHTIMKSSINTSGTVKTSKPADSYLYFNSKRSMDITGAVVLIVGVVLPLASLVWFALS